MHAHPRAAMLERDRDLAAVLARLHAAEIRSVYVEGGPTLASALVAAGLVDEYLSSSPRRCWAAPASRSETSASRASPGRTASACARSRSSATTSS
ncbi:Riboflavin biosynthesis protein RibD [Rathayibacter tanaceti]|uniref:Riboflavin biosynthesis protein RibD n=1 Tax=Rathayibacter tanaceti TaxID=1671680 RepID=A0A166HYJ9_9MICO|nr:Riboflavin biosynthesis protein RibD [Rathayibacter tanaceti]